ncbi:hypothetical protein K458DRAFT_206272 [Lentithecium fluviatile CBS 122367]|uniref:Uncharacterized protein n=1 Tax=Lentithecium fluviatile CBS 122367 TaxID=1168545 RepID=A0A6G1ICJ1_9PLEO|nr:hypothetical protein K458DRAFT_206272 [Lentithecium fluviatile CBS 122367]
MNVLGKRDRDSTSQSQPPTAARPAKAPRQDLEPDPPDPPFLPATGGAGETFTPRPHVEASAINRNIHNDQPMEDADDSLALECEEQPPVPSSTAPAVDSGMFDNVATF